MELPTLPTSGMGKTYVALGVVALFRHSNRRSGSFHRSRENIQRKWMKEARNFVATTSGTRTFASRESTEALHSPGLLWNLLELVNETIVGPDRDFFAE